MKNQYLCDIGDYGKYALLRAFAKDGIKIGVNWYLTEDDGSTDGKMTDYLDKEDIRYYDPELFDLLKAINSQPEKSVRLIEDYNVIPNAVYYSETLRSSSIDISEREMERMFWHNNSYAFLGKADLIFCDPDNGLTTKSVRAKDSEKFVVPEDIERYYNSGKNVVYYCHKGRRKSDAWEEAKTEMQRHIRDAKLIVMTYRKGTRRSYIFVVHPDCYQRYLDILNRFVEPFWYKAFWREPIYNIVPGDEEIGDQFEITLSDKTVLTMKTQADGRIRIYFSETPGSSMVLTPEMLKRRLQGR